MGELDRMYPLVYALWFRELLVPTGAELVTVPDAGYMAQCEQPGAVVAALRER